MICRSLTTLVFAALLSACSTVEPFEGIPEPARSEFIVASRSAETLTSYLADTTQLYNDQYHGTQVEYFGRNGQSFLWYPSNRSVVVGQWRMRQDGDDVDICFLYGANTYNPVTRESGGRWECRPLDRWERDVRAILENDPFRLSSRRVPFVLAPKIGHEAETLEAIWGRDVRLNYRFNRSTIQVTEQVIALTKKFYATLRANGLHP